MPPALFWMETGQFCVDGIPAAELLGELFSAFLVLELLPALIVLELLPALIVLELLPALMPWWEEYSLKFGCCEADSLLTTAAVEWSLETVTLALEDNRGKAEETGVENGLDVSGSARTVDSVEWFDDGDNLSSNASSGDLSIVLSIFGVLI